jgi:Ni/Co efflux regulator RcnB
MSKLLAAIVASTFALGAVSGYAADAAKKDELTAEQRADMRNRADQLTRARAAGTEQTTTKASHAPVTKKIHHSGKKSTKVKHQTAKKIQPKS